MTSGAAGDGPHTMARFHLSPRLRELAGDTFVYGFASVAGRFLSFVLVPLYARVFLPEEYGVVGVITAIYAVVALFAILGIDNAAFHLYFSTEDAGDRARTILTWVSFHLVFSVGISAVLWVSSEALAVAFLRGAPDAFLVKCLAATTLLESFGVVGTVVLRAQRRTWLLLLISVGKEALRGALTIVLILSFGFRVDGVLVAMVATAVPYCVINIAILIPVIRGAQFSRPRLMQLLRFGLPAAPASFAAWGMQSADRLILEHLRGLSHVGQYTLAASIAAVLGLGVAAFRQAWVPFALSIRNDADSKTTYSTVLTFYIAAATTGALALSLFAGPVVRLIAGDRYPGLAPVVTFLAFSWVAYGAYHVAYRGVIESGRTIHIGTTTVMGLVVGVALNFLLIPGFGASGSAVAGLVAQSTAAVLLMRKSQRHHRVDFQWREITIMLSSAALAATAGIISQTFPPERHLLAIGLLVCHTIVVIRCGATPWRGRTVKPLRGHDDLSAPTH